VSTLTATEPQEILQALAALELASTVALALTALASQVRTVLTELLAPASLARMAPTPPALALLVLMEPLATAILPVLTTLTWPTGLILASTLIATELQETLQVPVVLELDSMVPLEPTLVLTEPLALA